MVAVRSAKATLNAVEDQPQLPQQWEHWLPTTRTAIIRIALQTGTSDGLICASYARTAATAAARQPCPPTRPQGLLEPDARKRARPDLKGARRSGDPAYPATELRGSGHPLWSA